MSSVRKILLCVLLALPFCATAQEKHGGIIDMKGSFLRQLQKRDSVLVADQLQYGFKLDNVEEGTGFSLPDLSKVFTDSLGIDLIAPWVIDTLKVTKAKKSASRHFDIEGFVVIAPFEGANYTLPRIAILRAVKSGAVDTLLFDEQKLEVRSLSDVGSTSTFWNLLSNAPSFSMLFLYSSMVVAPIHCMVPLARAGFMMLAASMLPGVLPAPIMVCISSMNTMMSGFCSSSRSKVLILSSNCPRYFVPATMAVMSRLTTLLPKSIGEVR